MRKSIIRGALLGIVLLGFTIPGATLADGAGKGCSIQGTWFGVMGVGDTRLTGWMINVTGKSANEGENNIEYPNFDYTLDGNFPNVVSLSTMRGVWQRSGGNTFDYSFTGYAIDEFGVPVYIATVSGVATLIEDCRYEHITATMDVFLPFTDTDPFHDDPYLSFPLEPLYGYRLMPGD
jgi:hypothetical protein